MKKLFTLVFFFIICFGIKATEISQEEYWNNEIKFWFVTGSDSEDTYYYKDPYYMSTWFNAENRSNGNVRVICEDHGISTSKRINAVEILNGITNALADRGIFLMDQGGGKSSAWTEYRQKDITEIKIW